MFINRTVGGLNNDKIIIEAKLQCFNVSTSNIISVEALSFRHRIENTADLLYQKAISAGIAPSDVVRCGDCSIKKSVHIVL